MNVSDFTSILQNPNPVRLAQQTQALEAIIAEYPFFQAARALHLKGLKDSDSYHYHKALKATAAYTADREVLFHYITSPTFAQHKIADTIATRTPQHEEPPSPSSATALPRNLQDSQQIQSAEPLPRPYDPEALHSRPVSFAKDEKYSFIEWLQLTDHLAEAPTALSEEALEKKRKFALLDKFIKNNPKIVPKASVPIKVDLEASTTLNKNELMTETLAKVYVAQKQYKKAIQAYNILRLKYPEKSGFFADRIRAVQQLQKENE